MKKYLLFLVFIISGLIKGNAQALLDPASQPHFVNALPILPRVDVTAPGNLLTVTMEETIQNLGLVDSFGTPLFTVMWGYNFGSGATYPGKTIVAKKDVALQVRWVNELRNGFLLPVDTTILWALSELPGVWNPITRTPVPAVTHLHGAHSESASDGLSEAWYTPDYIYRGMDFLKTDDGTVNGNPIPFHYDNDQRASTLWYHDHALGLDRLSVYSGLAGAYLLRDDAENTLIAYNLLPAAPYEIELIIQDKMFTANGQLYYPSEPEEPGHPAISIHPEFFGDFILVNGKTWPKLAVEPRPYRFRLINASDSRFYNLYLNNDKETFIKIGTDGGLLEKPVSLKHLVLGPAQRADIVIDFTGFAGDTVVFRNDAATPFPGGDPVTAPASEVMAFIVNQPLNNSYPKAVLPAQFTVFNPMPAPTLTRRLLLFEAMDEYGRLKPSLGTVADGVMGMQDPVTESPSLNSTEMWEVFNATEDAHPIHIHLVRFQVVNTQKFTADMDTVTGALSNIVMSGPVHIPDSTELGWKDTQTMLPDEVTRIIATFDRAGKYAWHCHIMSHEDHEMMRPFVVTSANAISELSSSPQAMLKQNFPNPFNNNTQVNFNLLKDDLVNFSIYDLKGNKVVELINQVLPSGTHTVSINSDGLSDGIYYYTLQTGSTKEIKKMEIAK